MRSRNCNRLTNAGPILLFILKGLLCYSLVCRAQKPPPAHTAKPVLTAQWGHSSGVTTVAFSADGKFVLTGSFDDTAILWETVTGNELRQFNGHGSQVNSAVFSPDGRSVLTASEDHTARLWDVSTRQGDTEVCWTYLTELGLRHSP